jgi:YHS domain-containing protein
MMFLELFVPRGAFTAEQLSQLAEHLTMRQLLTHADAIGDVVDASEVSSVNPGVMDFVDSVNHVVVHEVGTWIVDGRPLDRAEPPRYLARVSVPGPWRKAMSAFLIASITRAISQASPEPGRCYREPCVEVHVIGVPEGGYGVFGRVAGESSLLDMISEAKTQAGAPDDPGVLIDPVCGMVASETVNTLEHEGTTYGFCSAGCRRHFAGQLTASR